VTGAHNLKSERVVKALERGDDVEPRFEVPGKESYSMISYSVYNSDSI
jgi:hypothetical protein